MSHRGDRRAEARHRSSVWGPEYRAVDRFQWPSQVEHGGVTRAFANNLFVVLVYDKATDPEGRKAVLVRMRPNDGKPLGRSLFRHLQDCKNQIFGAEARGAMYLPKESELEDYANLYWFYVREAVLAPVRVPEAPILSFVEVVDEHQKP